MHYISSLAAVAALACAVSASDAPVVKNNPIGVTYSASLPNKGSITGSVKGAAAPDGTGVNIQVAFYDLPSNSGNLSYQIYSGSVGKNADCSAAGSVLNPYGGQTGSKCATDEASCAIGDLADKHGGLKIESGGSGTGFFSANYVDEYLSMVPGAEAFFGKGSLVILDGTGATLACAQFINPVKAAGNSTSTASSSTSSHGGQATGHSGGSGGSGSSASSTSSGNGAAQMTAFVGAGALGLAAMLL